MVLTNILLGVIIFLLINIYGGINLINSKLLSNAEYLRLKKLSDSLVRGPIITKVKNKSGYGTKPRTERPKPKPRPYNKRG